MVMLYNNLNYRLSLIQKKIPVIAFIEGCKVLIFLVQYCVVKFVYQVYLLIQENTKFYANQVVKYLKEKSKLPDMLIKIIN